MIGNKAKAGLDPHDYVDSLIGICLVVDLVGFCLSAKPSSEW